jgi:hypothetical protein
MCGDGRAKNGTYLDFLIALIAEVASATSHFGAAHRELLGGEVLLGLDLCGGVRNGCVGR